MSTLASLKKCQLIDLIGERDAEILALREKVQTLTGDVAARDTRIANAVIAFRALRAEKALPAKPVAHRSTFVGRDGVLMERVRVGNTARIRPVMLPAAPDQAH